MSIKIATYNVNNLFERARVLELKGFSEKAKEILDDIEELCGLLEKPSYADAVGVRLKELLEKYNFHKDSKNDYFDINQIRGKLYRVKKDKSSLSLAVKGRAEWLGWVEMKRSEVDEEATQNTARVINAVKADVICLVEVEDRTTLKRFNEKILGKFQPRYKHVMLIDGNDERGIDLAVMSKLPIVSLRSHVDDTYKSGNKNYITFSRDCPEYEIALPGGKSLWLLCNHFKSKGYGSQTSSDKKRGRQADRVREILGRFDLKNDYVAVCGDFNDTPESEPLKNLLATTDLHDVLSLPLYGNAPRWTYSDGADQIDYLLASKALFDRLKKVGIERRGIYSKNDFGGQFPHFPEITSYANHASDHACVWAEFDI